MAKSQTQTVADKIRATTGSQDMSSIASQLNDKIGKPLDISKSRGPLKESGTVLPPIKIKK